MLEVGNGTGHPRGIQTTTRTLTRAHPDPKHLGSRSCDHMQNKTVKTCVLTVFLFFKIIYVTPAGLGCSNSDPHPDP
jgi:hypothetical protein